MGKPCQIFRSLILTQLWVTEITFIVPQPGHHIWIGIPDAECLSNKSCGHVAYAWLFF